MYTTPRYTSTHNLSILRLWTLFAADETSAIRLPLWMSKHIPSNVSIFCAHASTNSRWETMFFNSTKKLFQNCRCFIVSITQKIHNFSAESVTSSVYNKFPSKSKCEMQARTKSSGMKKNSLVVLYHLEYCNFKI